jgi:pilus assembly protein CpaF
MKPLGFGRKTAPLQFGGTPVSPGRRGLVATADPQAPDGASVAREEPLSAGQSSRANVVDALYELVLADLPDLMPVKQAKLKSRGDLAALITERVRATARAQGQDVTEGDVRDAVTVLLNDYMDMIGGLEADPAAAAPKPKPEPKADPAADVAARNAAASRQSVVEAKERIFPILMEHIDASAINELSREELAEQVGLVIGDLTVQEKINLNHVEHRDLVTLILNDMLGLGPLEPLLADDAITDIMVNGPSQVYAERKGKLELTDVKFRDDQQLINIAQKIVSAVGRRVDETSPICDARLLDGSRVNVIIPPLAIDGASISIRKFSKKKITLEKMAEIGSISPKMCRLLQIAGRCRMNIIISGGTGSGKTTMLNAISRNIDPGERVVTIEDAAELQLQQPHVVRLETRPPNLEGNGEITMRDLVKNALRMRPDRIILGEVRGGEAIDLLQAMNTGHDGSLGTLHANKPREALVRLENMVNMAGLNLPAKAIRAQIAEAVGIVVQVNRMRDGGRRCTYITEVVGMEGDVIVTQDLYTYQYQGEGEDGKLRGEFLSSGLRPYFMERAEYFGLGRALMECM